MTQFHVRRMNWIALTLAAVLVAAPARADERDDRIAQLEAKVAALQKENAELRARLAGESADAPTPAPPSAAPAADLTDMQRELEAAREKTQRLEAEMVELEKLAGVSAKGELIASAASLFEITHDEQANTTTVRAKPKRVVSTNVPGFSEYRLGGSFTAPAPGSKGGTAESISAALPEAYQLELYTYGNPNRWLKTVKSGTLRIDGQDFEVPIADYTVIDELKAPPGIGRQSVGGGVQARDERLSLTLSPELAERLGRAQTLELILPKAEFELGREHIAMVEALRIRAQKLADGAAE